MGDNATHAVFFGAYWHLAYKQDGWWWDAREFSKVCRQGAEDDLLELPRKV